VRDILEGLEQTGWVLAFGKSNFWYGLTTALHYFSMFIVTGTSVIFDMYLLGFVAKGQKASEFAEQVFPWHRQSGGRTFDLAMAGRNFCW
jgi:hypothetical protein